MPSGRKRGQRTKVTARTIANTKRRKQALDLRLQGMTYDQVGAAMGITGQGAHRLVMAAFKDTQDKLAESAEDLRVQQEQRLDRMLLGLMPGVDAGDPQSVNAAIRIEERRAKLRGLDSPAKSEVSGPEGGAIQIATPTIYLPAERSDEESTGLPDSGEQE